MNLGNRQWLYLGLCAVFFIYTGIVITSGTDYSKGNELLTEEARSGEKLFKKYNCTACHQLWGMGGYMGPDLTNCIADKGETYAAVFIKNGTVKMPNFGMMDNEVNDLIAYKCRIKYCV